MAGYSRWRLILTGAAGAVSLAGALVISALGQPPTPEPAPEPAPPAGQTYTGSKRCVICHREQAATWADTKHANAFTDLPANYRSDPSCLACHITGYGQAGGYAAGTPAQTLEDLLDVGCEACHGPGSEHEKVAQQFAESAPGEEQKLEKQLRDTIYKVRPDNACVECHVTPQGHQRHPPYEGQPQQALYGGQTSSSNYAATNLASRLPSAHAGSEPAPPPGQRYAGTKPCAACHYQQYQTWLTDKHAASLTNMPAKYWTDAKCLECHITGYGAPGGYAMETDPRVLAGLLSVTCEACHGPGSGHVRFTRQFITSPPLGPELEQMARDAIYKVLPGNGCARCHVRQAHKVHPEYDKAAQNP